jgi:hypothetical protein
VNEAVVAEQGAMTSAAGLKQVLNAPVERRLPVTSILTVCEAHEEWNEGGQISWLGFAKFK